MCPVPTVQGNVAEPLIDGFEDGNAGLEMKGGRAGGWYVLSDGTMPPTAMIMPPADPSMPPNPVCNGAGFMSKCAMRLTGGGFRAWGASIGTNFLHVPNRMLPCPYDVSQYVGVRFQIKGYVADNIVRVGVFTTDTVTIPNGGTCDDTKQKCYDNFSIEISPTGMWNLIQVPFDDLRQLQGGMMKLNRAHVLGLEFGVHGGGSVAGGACPDSCNFDFWIDNVEFYN